MYFNTVQAKEIIKGSGIINLTFQKDIILFSHSGKNTICDIANSLISSGIIEVSTDKYQDRNVIPELIDSFEIFIKPVETFSQEVGIYLDDENFLIESSSTIVYKDGNYYKIEGCKDITNNYKVFGDLLYIKNSKHIYTICNYKSKIIKRLKVSFEIIDFVNEKFFVGEEKGCLVLSDCISGGVIFSTWRTGFEKNYYVFSELAKLLIISENYIKIWNIVDKSFQINSITVIDTDRFEDCVIFGEKDRISILDLFNNTTIFSGRFYDGDITSVAIKNLSEIYYVDKGNLYHFDISLSEKKLIISGVKSINNFKGKLEVFLDEHRFFKIDFS